MRNTLCDEADKLIARLTAENAEKTKMERVANDSLTAERAINDSLAAENAALRERVGLLVALIADHAEEEASE